MRLAALTFVVAVAGCGPRRGAPPTTSPPITSTEPEPELEPEPDRAPDPVVRVRPEDFAILPAPVCAGGERLRGHVRDERTGEPLIGATVVVNSRDAAITDETGTYCIEVEGEDVLIDVYYYEATVHGTEHLGNAVHHVAADLILDPSYDDGIIELDDVPHCGQSDC